MQYDYVQVHVHINVYMHILVYSVESGEMPIYLDIMCNKSNSGAMPQWVHVYMCAHLNACKMNCTCGQSKMGMALIS